MGCGDCDDGSPTGSSGFSLSGFQVNPEGSKVPKYGESMASALGVVVMVLGRYLVFGYLDPQWYS